MTCPDDGGELYPIRSRVVEVLDGVATIVDRERLWCPNQAHDGRPRTSPAGFEPASRSRFTAEEATRHD